MDNSTTVSTKTVTCGVCGVERQVAKGASLRRMRKAKGWKLREVARAFGFDHGHLSNVERGKKVATARMVEVYSKLKVKVRAKVVNVKDTKE